MLGGQQIGSLVPLPLGDTVWQEAQHLQGMTVRRATIALVELQIKSDVGHPLLLANSVQVATLIPKGPFVHQGISARGVEQISLLAVQQQDITVLGVQAVVMGSLAPMGTIVLVEQQTRLPVRLLLASIVRQVHLCSQG